MYVYVLCIYLETESTYHLKCEHEPKVDWHLTVRMYTFPSRFE